MTCGSGGSKSRLAKAAGAEPAGQMRDEKLHAVVARSTFPSQNVQNTPGSDHFWKLRCRKNARRCGAKHISVESTSRSEHFWKLTCWKSGRRCGAKRVSKSKCTKHLTFGALLEVDMSKKCTPLWREARFQVKMLKPPHVRTAFARSNFVFAWHALGIVHLVNNEQSVRVLWHFQKHPKTMAGVGHLKRISKDALSVAGAVQETCSSSEMLGCPGADFLREVAFWIIRSSIFGKVILCDRCSNSYDLAPFFRRRRNTFRQMEWTNCKTHWHEAVSSALNFPFLKEASKNCFVWCCQLR